jgi:hypothetical protein
MMVVLTFLTTSVFAQQITILLVDDDNYSSPNHIERIETAITDAGYSYTLFNAQDSGATPANAVMSQYDLVFWYNANDGAGGYFWDGRDTVNVELKNYMDGGGMVWAMGNDIIYDRYGGAPDTFQTGDFLYDYFGIHRYDSQSKSNDGGSGVTILLKLPNQQVATSLDTIKWYLSGGLNYADGCTPRSEADSVHEFGPDTYQLAGGKTSIFYTNGVFYNFGTYWDAYYMDSAENRAVFFEDVLDYFNNIKYPSLVEDDVHRIPHTFTVQQNFPNPFNPNTSIQFKLPKAGEIRITIFNVSGEKLVQHTAYYSAGSNQFDVQAKGWASGVYLYRIEFEGAISVRKMMLIK